MKIKMSLLSMIVGSSLILGGCSQSETINLYQEGNINTTLKNDNIFEMNQVNTTMWLENIDSEDGVTTIYISPAITAVGENIDYMMLSYLEVVFNDTTLGNIQVDKIIGYNHEGTIEKDTTKMATIVGLIPMELTEEQMLDVGRVVYKMELDGRETICSLLDIDLVKNESERDDEGMESSKREIEQLKNQ